MSIGLIIDIALLIIAVITIIRYTCVGAVKAVFSFAKTFVAIWLAYFLRKPAAMLRYPRRHPGRSGDCLHQIRLQSHADREC